MYLYLAAHDGLFTRAAALRCGRDVSAEADVNLSDEPLEQPAVRRARHRVARILGGLERVGHAHNGPRANVLGDEGLHEIFGVHFEEVSASGEVPADSRLGKNLEFASKWLTPENLKLIGELTTYAQQRDRTILELAIACCLRNRWWER